MKGCFQRSHNVEQSQSSDSTETSVHSGGLTLIRLTPWKEALSSDNGQYDLVKTENSIRFSDRADDYAMNKEDGGGTFNKQILKTDYMAEQYSADCVPVHIDQSKVTW